MILFEVEPDKQSEDGGFLAWLEERDRVIAACALREGGHRWLIEGEPGEEPCLSCQDCPASADDVLPDLLDELAYHDTPETIGGHSVHWGRPLPADATPYTIPVNIRVETTAAMTDYGTEYRAEIEITLRGGETA